MSANAQKTPFVSTQSRFAEGKARDALQKTGKSLPCSVVKVSGAIITVRFEVQSGFTLPNVTVPLFGPEYIRYPIQPGDKGLVFAADAYLGGMSGLGGGVADLATRANLTSLVFFPMGNKFWSTVDPNSVTVYGPNGVVLRDTGSNSQIILTPSGIIVTGQNSVLIKCGQCSIQMTPTTITITDSIAHTSPATMNAAWNALTTWLNSHTHGDAQGGSTSAPLGAFNGSNVAP